MLDALVTAFFPTVVIPFIMLAVAAGGIVLALNVLWNHFQREAEHQRRSFEFWPTSEFNLDALTAFERALHGMDTPRALTPIHAISIEVLTAYGAAERYFLHIPGHMHERVHEWLQAHLPCPVEPVKPEDDPIRNTKWQRAAELKYGHASLDIVDPVRTSTTVGTRGANMQEGEMLVHQVTLFPARKQRATPETKDKYASNTFSCILRVAAVGDRPDKILKDAFGNLKSIEHEGAKLTKQPSWNAPLRVSKRSTSLFFPNIFNELELAVVSRLPLAGGTAVRARDIPPTSAHDTEGIQLGVSNSPRAIGRKIAIPLDGMFRHGHLMAPPGGGKSNFGMNLLMQTIARRDTAVFAIDPGDMVFDMIDCIPKEDIDRVVYIDVEDKDYPIGISVFSGDDPERTAGQIVGMFKAISGDNWGTRLERILRNTALTAAILKLPFYTLLPLLTNETYRKEQVKRVPRSRYPFVHDEWAFLDETKDAKDSVVNKLVQFVGYELVRHMVAQSKGIDFDAILRDHKIALLRLHPRAVPKPAAKAIAQIILELVWDAAQRQPDNARQPSFVFVDEVHNFGHALINPDSNRLAEARKYRQSYWMAHQYAKQLEPNIMESIKHNVQNQVVWRVSAEDAERVAKTFPPLKAEEIAALPERTVVARLFGSQGYTPSVTFKPSPPPPSTGSRARIIANSRKLYARPVAEVRAEIAAMHRGGEGRQRPIIGRPDDD